MTVRAVELTKAARAEGSPRYGARNAGSEGEAGGAASRCGSGRACARRRNPKIYRAVAHRRRSFRQLWLDAKGDRPARSDFAPRAAPYADARKIARFRVGCGRRSPHRRAVRPSSKKFMANAAIRAEPSVLAELRRRFQRAAGLTDEELMVTPAQAAAPVASAEPEVEASTVEELPELSAERRLPMRSRMPCEASEEPSIEIEEVNGAQPTPSSKP